MGGGGRGHKKGRKGEKEKRGKGKKRELGETKPFSPFPSYPYTLFNPLLIFLPSPTSSLPLAAVADAFSFHHIDHLFGDIGGVVPHPFQVADDVDLALAGRDRLPVGRHVF